MKKDFDSSDVILSSEMSSKKKINKEEEENCLAENSKRLDNSVFSRAFFFQF